MYKRLNCFTSLPAFVTFCIFDDNHPNRCVMIPRCGFHLYFSDSNMSVFLSTYWPSVCLLWKIVQVICPFCYWIVCFFFFFCCCLSLLYILCIKSLSDIWFANIFSHLVGCLFILLIFFFCVDFEFDTVPLVYFLFCCFYFCCQI